MSEEPNSTAKPQTTPAPADNAPQPPASAPAKTKRDRWVKIGFLVAIVGVAIFVYTQQQDAMEIDGWGSDLDAALQQAREENRPVVAFFVDTPPSNTAEQTRKVVLTNPENKKVMAKLRVIRVLVSDPGDNVRETYAINSLPTLLLLSPEGKELSRHDGLSHVGEVPFRKEFLVPIQTP